MANHSPPRSYTPDELRRVAASFRVVLDGLEGVATNMEEASIESVPVRYWKVGERASDQFVKFVADAQQQLVAKTLKAGE